jgi:ABC-type uncharacterized transport system fused permease/ATPase subunit
MIKSELLWGYLLIAGGTIGIGIWTNNVWASVTYFFSCYLFIMALGEISLMLWKLNNQIEEMRSNLRTGEIRENLIRLNEQLDEIKFALEK